MGPNNRFVWSQSCQGFVSMARFPNYRFRIAFGRSGFLLILEVCILYAGMSWFPFEIGRDSIHSLATNDRIVTKFLWSALLTIIHNISYES
jgi:hypothetical protein